MSTAGIDARVAAARLISAVVHDGRSLSHAGATIIAALGDERDRAFAQACAYGVLRSLYSLRARLAELMGKPLRAKDGDIEALLLSGLYQLGGMRLPAHAAVSATVAAARSLGKPWACALINGVLRQALRGGFARPPAPDPSAAFEHPSWLIDRLQRDWPEHWQAILNAANEQPPLTLRVNVRRTTVATYQQALSAAGIVATRTRHAGAALRLAASLPVSALPHFDDGWVSVQDEAAQLASDLLAPAAGMRVLDACAAPGGKTAQLLECHPDLDLLALERDPARVPRLHGNLARLGLECAIRVADATETSTWWDGRPFDRILLDAPCSALGIVRRQPDIRVHRRPADLVALAVEQSRLLEALWPLLGAGGKLLYCVCSVIPAETDGPIADLLARHPEGRAEELPVAWGLATRHGRQILPGSDAMDGFYYALVGKPGGSA